jgi:hypothetical protein
MKRERLHLPEDLSIETGPDWNGRYYVAYRKGCSMFFRNVEAMRQFLALPRNSASNGALDSWLASLQAADEDKAAAKQEASKETSFDPLAHEDDPALSTKMII